MPVLAGRPASSQPIQYRCPGQPRFSFPGTPMPDLQNRTADPHSGPDCRGMRLLSHAHDHRHLMSTISMPSIKSLPSSLALLRAPGDPCREPSFWPSKKHWRRLPPTKLSPSQVEADCFYRRLVPAPVTCPDSHQPDRHSIPIAHGPAQVGVDMCC